MKYLIITITALVFSASAFSAKLADTNYNENFSYKVRFTNPVCDAYKYPSGTKTRSGKDLEKTPKNVFCKRGDSKPSAARKESPEYNLTKWIRDPHTSEIFMTFLSFSSSRITAELVKAVEERNVKITFILDRGSLKFRNGPKKEVSAAKAIEACRENDASEIKKLPSGFSKACKIIGAKPENGKKEYEPKFYIRGQEGSLGYAHNKLMIFNPNDREYMRLVYGSGNMSSGIVLHHENWHFVTTDVDTHFAQVHLCLREGMLEHGKSKKLFVPFMKKCRAKIEYAEEEDVQTYFVPGEGKAATKLVGDAIKRAVSIDIAAHRFLNSTILVNKSKNDGYLFNKLKKKDASVRLVVDDDVWWSANLPRDPVEKKRYQESCGTCGAQEGEYKGKVQPLEKLGMKVKYMQTNHWIRTIHHNKYMVFDFAKEADAVFAGAGNFTGAAFSKNYENFYYIRIPSVVEDFKKQYSYKWKKLAVSKSKLPKTNVKPL